MPGIFGIRGFPENLTEVLLIQRDHIEAKVKGCCSDDQVCECNGDPDCRLFALDAPGNLSDRERNRMNDEAGEDIFSEGAATFPVTNGSGPVNAVGELDGADYR